VAAKVAKVHERPIIERLPAVLGRTGMPKSSLYKQIAKGEFPRPVKLGKRAVGWLSTSIDEWIRTRGQAAA
jgi:prophage regulatory protein